MRKKLIAANWKMYKKPGTVPVFRPRFSFFQAAPFSRYLGGNQLRDAA
jgi:hypothetical protein